jgi:uncharacterized integral membrane protein
MRHFKLVVVLALVGLVVMFTLQNLEAVQVNLLFWSFTLRRSVLIFAVLFVGVIAGWTLHSLRRPRRRPDSQR